MLHVRLCLSVIMFLICMCWHQKGCAGYCLVEGKGDKQVGLIECLNHTACFWLYKVPVLYFIMMHLVLTGT